MASDENDLIWGLLLKRKPSHFLKMGKCSPSLKWLNKYHYSLHGTLFAKLFSFFIFGPDVIRQLFAWMDPLLEEVVWPQTHSPAVLHRNTFNTIPAWILAHPPPPTPLCSVWFSHTFKGKWVSCDNFRSFYKTSSTISSQTTWSFMHRTAYNNAIHFIHVS